MTAAVEYMQKHSIRIDPSKAYEDIIGDLRPAEPFKQQVKDMLLNREEIKGLKLPWSKANGFHFRDSELTIWTGYNGHRKSLLLGYILLALLAQEQSAAIASLEMPPRRTLWRMCKQFVGNGDPTMPMVDRFFGFLTNKLYIYDHVGTTTPDHMVALVKYAAKMNNCKHIVIDSLMKCGIGSDDYNKQKHFIDALTAAAHDYECHVHLVAHSRKPEGARESIPSSKYGVKGASEITDMADNVIVVYAEQDENRKNDAMFICDKQRNGEDEPMYKLTFDEDSLQFKSFDNAPRLHPEDWENCRWT